MPAVLDTPKGLRDACLCVYTCTCMCVTNVVIGSSAFEAVGCLRPTSACTLEKHEAVSISVLACALQAMLVLHILEEVA